MSLSADDSKPPQALLLVTPGCAHCASTKRILDKLLQEGLLAGIEIVDVTKQPELAQSHQVKSVPWLKLGPIHLQGAQTEADLRQWLNQLAPASTSTELLKRLLDTDALDQVIDMVEQRPALVADLLPLVADPEQDLKIRLGVSAVMEHFENKPALQKIIKPLGELVNSRHPRVRADAAHFLLLTHSPEAMPCLRQLMQDEDREVREIAGEGG